MFNSVEPTTTEKQVYNLINKYPNCKWYWMHDVGGLTYAQYRYHAEKMAEKGIVVRIFHGHNQHNGWTGYKVVKNVSS